MNYFEYNRLKIFCHLQSVKKKISFSGIIDCRFWEEFIFALSFYCLKWTVIFMFILSKVYFFCIPLCQISKIGFPHIISSELLQLHWWIKEWNKCNHSHHFLNFLYTSQDSCKHLGKNHNSIENDILKISTTSLNYTFLNFSSVWIFRKGNFFLPFVFLSRLLQKREEEEDISLL